MTKSKLENAAKALLDEHGDRIVMDCIDYDENVSYRKITFREVVDVTKPCCRGDIKKLEDLLAKTKEKPLEVKDHYIHNTPEDKARRRERARQTLAFGAALAGKHLGPYMPILKRL